MKAPVKAKLKEKFTAATYFHNPRGTWMLVREYPPAKQATARIHLAQVSQDAMRTFEGEVLAAGPDVTTVSVGDTVSWAPHDGSSNGHLQATMDAGLIQWLKEDMVISTVGHAQRAEWIAAKHQAAIDEDNEAGGNLAAERARLVAAQEDDGLDPALPA